MHASRGGYAAPAPPLPVPAPLSETWRDEVASRVHSYRARHNPRAAEKETLALDLLPAAGETAVADPIAGSMPAGALVHGLDNLRLESSNSNTFDRAPRRNSHKPAENTFDTNYYRRLNAHALEQGLQTMDAAGAHPRSAEHGQLWGTAANGQELQAEGKAARNAVAPSAPKFEAETAAVFDLELRAPLSGDACLERYCIRGEEAGDCPTEIELNSPAPFVAPPFAARAVAPAEAPRADAASANAAPNPAPQQNLIVFPRPMLEPPLLPQPSRDELADPVHPRPRILEVPEDIMPCVQGSLFPEIRLDGEEVEVSGAREPKFEIPLPVAPLSARLKAGVADWLVVMAAGGLFAAIAGRAMPELPHAKPFWMALAAVIVLQWVAYQCLFLLYAGRTVGMRVAGIRLSTFDGRPPRWSERRRRTRFVLISFASVAIGFLWALVDEDTLCWHDRVSRTFPTMEPDHGVRRV